MLTSSFINQSTGHRSEIADDFLIRNTGLYILFYIKYELQNKFSILQLFLPKYNLCMSGLFVFLSFHAFPFLSSLSCLKQPFWLFKCIVFSETDRNVGVLHCLRQALKELRLSFPTAASSKCPGRNRSDPQAYPTFFPALSHLTKITEPYVVVVVASVCGIISLS